ncbi:hypothetical protein ACVWXL_006916 [Bradyrhizobium sp. GM22.5]
MLQIVAGIVLHQLVEASDDGAVGQHDFEPEHQFARHAIADHAIAAGIGREVAADGAGAARAEIERKEEAGFVGCHLDRLKRRACFHRHRHRGVIDLLDPAHALERDRDPACFRRCAAAQPSQSALRHERQMRLPAGQNRVGHALRIDRADHRERRLRQARAPVVAIARGHVRANEHGGRAEAVAQGAEQLGGPLDRGHHVHARPPRNLAACYARHDGGKDLRLCCM